VAQQGQLLDELLAEDVYVSLAPAKGTRRSISSSNARTRATCLRIAARVSRTSDAVTARRDVVTGGLFIAARRGIAPTTRMLPSNGSGSCGHTSEFSSPADTSARSEPRRTATSSPRVSPARSPRLEADATTEKGTAGRRKSAVGRKWRRRFAEGGHTHHAPWTRGRLSQIGSRTSAMRSWSSCVVCRRYPCRQSSNCYAPRRSSTFAKRRAGEGRYRASKSASGS